MNRFGLRSKISAIIDKRRAAANESEVMNIIGDVKNKICIVPDDIIDTAGTLCNSFGSNINLRSLPNVSDFSWDSSSSIWASSFISSSSDSSKEFAPCILVIVSLYFSNFSTIGFRSENSLFNSL